MLQLLTASAIPNLMGETAAQGTENSNLHEELHEPLPRLWGAIRSYGAT
jgi:hypothetical protein